MTQIYVITFNVDTLIKEDFINLTFGLTFNDLWFQKRKYR